MGEAFNPAWKGKVKYLFDRAVGVKDAHADGGAVGDGAADDAAKLNAFLTAIAGRSGYLPPGTYSIGSGLTIPANTKLFGERASIIKPTSAVAKAILMSSGSVLQGVTVDGSATSGKVGIDMGGSSEINDATLRDIFVAGFAGSGGIGIDIDRCVTPLLDNVYVDDCQDGLEIGGTEGFPTDGKFNHLISKSNDRYGVKLISGYSLTFIGGKNEINGQEGVHASNSSRTLSGVRFLGTWFENNWQSVDDATRATKYDVTIDGTGATIIENVELLSARFQDSPTTPKAFHFTDVQDYLIDATQVKATNGQILIDGSLSTGWFSNWPENNGALTSSGGLPATVTDTSGTAKVYALRGKTALVPGGATNALISLSSQASSAAHPVSIANNATGVIGAIATGLLIVQDLNSGASAVVHVGVNTAVVVSSTPNSGVNWTATLGSASNLNVSVAGSVVSCENKSGATASIIIMQLHLA